MCLSCTIFIYYSSFTGEVLGQSENPAQTLKLTLETEKDSLVLGEPVYLIVKLKNIGSKPARIDKNIRPEDGLLKLFMTPPDTKAFGFVPLFIIDHSDTLEFLEQDSLIAEVIPVFYGARGWTFQNAGSYTAKATYQSRTQREIVMSNLIKIEVLKGNDEAGDFLFDNKKKSHEAGKFLLWQSGDHLRKGIAHLKELKNNFPNSPINDYIFLALGRSFGSSFKDYAAGKVRLPDDSTAIDNLSQVKEDRLPTFSIIQKKLAEAKSYIRLDDKNKAWKRLECARRLIGQRPEFRGFVRQLNMLEEIAKPGDIPPGDDDSQK